MRKINKRIIKKAIALILATCLTAINPMITYAETNTQLSVWELSDVLINMQTMIRNLDELGFSLKDIADLFAISGNVSAQDLQMLYRLSKTKGDSLQSFFDQKKSSKTNESEQIRRLCNVYSIAQNNPSGYYEGNLNNAADFGNYVVYLYLSHYVDGAGKASASNHLPYIISSDDIAAYNSFLNASDSSSYFPGIACLAALCYDNFDYDQTTEQIHVINSVLEENIALLSAAGNDEYGSKSAKNTSHIVLERVLQYYSNNYSDDMEEDDFQVNTCNYVKENLNMPNLYADDEEAFLSTLISSMTEVMWCVAANTSSNFCALTAALPLFVHSFTGIVQTAVWVNLKYSFSRRYAERIGIYLDM